MTSVLDLADVKNDLRVDAGDDDTLVTHLIAVAQEHVETVTGLVLTPRKLTETARELGRWIDLSSWPVTEVTAVRVPLLGVMTPLASTAWLVSLARRPVRLVPATWGWGVGGGYRQPLRAMLPIEIDVAAGYATPDLIPQAVKQAMRLLVAHWYSNRAAAEVGARAAAVEIPFGVAELLRPWRRMAI